MPRSAAHSRKKIYALCNSSQPAATATCCGREFSIFQVQVQANSLDYWVVKHFVFVYLLGKQAEENSKELYFEISVGFIRIQAVRRPEWQPTDIQLID